MYKYMMFYRKENAKYAMSFTKSHLQIDMTIYVINEF